MDLLLPWGNEHRLGSIQQPYETIHSHEPHSDDGFDGYVRGGHVDGCRLRAVGEDWQHLFSSRGDGMGNQPDWNALFPL